MAINVTRGAWTGRETKLYYNDPDATPTPGTYEAPIWVEVPRIRNIQRTDGRAFSELDFHGQQETSGVPGYRKFSGSMEYVRKKGTDVLYDALKAASLNGDPVDLAHINGAIATDGHIGWRAVVLLGEFQNTSNGGDAVVETIPFIIADAYDAADAKITKTRALTASGAITDPDAGP